MRLLRRIVLGAGWVVGGLGLLLTGLYLTALAVNRHDRPESAIAREVTAALDAVPAVVDADNGYVYLLGFGAPRGAEPWRIGAERAAWIRGMRANGRLRRDSDPHPVDSAGNVTPPLAGFFQRCPGAEQRECFAALSDSQAEIEPWLAEHAWVIERYAALLGHPGWREIGTHDFRNPAGGFSVVMQAQRAWFVAAWWQAGRGDAAGVREMLARDAAFWRRVLAASHSLLTKQIAGALLERHFKMGNLVLKRLPAARAAEAVPAAWRAPISPAERSLQSALAAELRASRAWIESLTGHGDTAAADFNREQGPQTLLEWLDDGVGGAFLQPQDTLNKRARQLAVVADASVAPYARLPEAVAAAREFDVFASRSRAWTEPLYNWLMDSQLAIGGLDPYVDPVAKLGDLEGVRRAALLAVELRGRGIAPGAVEAGLAGAALTDPYTDAPLGWDGRTGTIVFTGLERGTRKRHALWY